jgi:serine/threonine protein kinase
MARQLLRGAIMHATVEGEMSHNMNGSVAHGGILPPGALVAERYQVGLMLGAGSSGVVYEARHIGLNRPVALKVIRPDIARDSSVWRRFSREARVLAALHNKHVVRILDTGSLDSGLTYFVMDRLQGTDLRRLLQVEGALPPQRAVDYVIPVCSALADAHRLNIIHRDIKPENIFLAEIRACEPTIKLLDFGVALFLDDAAQCTLPAPGMGPPFYLSPEQLVDPRAVDGRTDIWAVGLLLYELLAGRSPLSGLDISQMYLKIVQGPMPRIEAACPGLPVELAAAVNRCLQIDPAERPQSADELISALEPFCSRHAPTRAPAGEYSASGKGAGMERTVQPQSP